jgi:branched-chain amino acid transport system substrate-binding protein
VVQYKVESGMSLPDFHKAWDKTYPDTKVAFGFNAVAGYTTGLVIQNALAATKSMKQLDLRDAVFSLSGKLKTIDGTFELDKNGAQIGEITPLGQLVPDGKGSLKFTVVYPKDVATGKPVYPAPAQ